MPSLKKKALSLYLRNTCQRQLLLNLYSDAERKTYGMPERQQARAGLGLVGAMGYTWQDEKVSELASVFGKDAVHVSATMTNNRPAALPLPTVLPHLKPYQFIVEGQYDAATQTFKDAVGLSSLHDRFGMPLDVGNALPDLIQVLPPARHPAAWETIQPDRGQIPTLQAVQPNGDVVTLEATDDRLRLRVIDIKLAAEPGAHYFAEVVYYSITLAAWLKDHGWDQDYVVIAAPAVWPGSYEASRIQRVFYEYQKKGQQASPDVLASALEDDIEIAPFDAFAPRLRRFFHEELPMVLQTPWDQLPWHVTNTCNGCEFLGYPWKDRTGAVANSPLHCWPTAEATGHLSRVVGLSKGGAKLLRDAVADISVLAQVSDADNIFNRSPSLRAKRTIYPHRARALAHNLTGTIPNAGGSALMPRWPDLHIYLFLDYDLSSAITATLSLRAFWKEPLPFGSAEKAESKRWAKDTRFQEVYLVDQRSLTREREELLKFLRALHAIMNDVKQQDDHDCTANRRGDPSKPEKQTRSTYQIYLWDEAQRKQLTRIVGRHLDAILADPKLRNLAWLFPPPELLSHAEEASYKSSFTVVSSVVQNTVAVPVPHHYTLLDVARTYHPPSVGEISVHPLYREPLSDLIPGERIHEMWTRRGDYTQTLRTIEETTAKKLNALAFVVAQLEKDLKPLLNHAAAPPLVKKPPQLTSLPFQSLLWYEYTRLNQAMAELDDHTLRTMPAHEREARFKSAHLLQRLDGAAKNTAYALLQKTAPQTLDRITDLFIYTLNPDSYAFNVRPPALGYALSPRHNPAFLNTPAYPLTSSHGINVYANGTIAEAGLTKVSVEAIDRVNGLIALKPAFTNCVMPLEQAGAIDFSTDMMLDPVGDDYLSRKLSLTLQGIGHPATAGDHAEAAFALGRSTPSSAASTPETPAAEFLWQAARLATQTIARDVDSVQAQLQMHEPLNDSQWAAWRAALTQRLALIWGPPGTGKSQTLRAIIAGAVLSAQKQQHPLRILIASNTYTAIDNVLLGLDTVLQTIFGTNAAKACRLYRLHSQYSEPPAELVTHPAITPIPVKKTQSSSEVQALQALLDAPTGIVIVAGPPQQLHNLAIATDKKSKSPPVQIKHTQKRWFDLILIDEASQLGVAEATLIVSKAATNAAFILAGDDKQLPPIHPATPPEGLEYLVGSVYNYVRHYHNVDPLPLQINYRSCQTLVDFTKQVGYDPGLSAFHSNLRLSILPPGLPVERPPLWPNDLYWTPDWLRVLNPADPAVCFIYEDDVAGQANAFEADAVTALLWLLYGRLDQQLTGEYQGTTERALSGQTYDEKRFWERAVGVVTPHRAQMSSIVSRLHTIFPEHNPTAIWNAVDTVERFQGQQRDVIIASFGLGDADLIRSEDEFLYSLNRFNVMASRARAKLIVLLTRSLVDHLADDSDVLEESRLLKNYAESFCQLSTSLTLGYRENGIDILRSGILRTRA
ncbi:DEAD/DEAH box helicase [Herpetosiphon geysericola]|uniref:Uncharacterized protein n=1 Tax=Herpetosiphon geysericola TaxID=70996 RepID=A0A0P6XK95_9CHLR|nr:ATP-binding protein [Herpetosiphon geysericola]KPL80620.1 hypothetical protein SE18_23685 [Herpetosiphon geysericola]